MMMKRKVPFLSRKEKQQAIKSEGKYESKVERQERVTNSESYPLFKQRT